MQFIGAKVRVVKEISKITGVSTSDEPEEPHALPSSKQLLPPEEQLPLSDKELQPIEEESGRCTVSPLMSLDCCASLLYIVTACSILYTAISMNCS